MTRWRRLEGEVAILEKTDISSGLDVCRQYVRFVGFTNASLYHYDRVCVEREFEQF